ncbi:hypothetical protein LCGC14_0915350 [marine sediment metagenome]|uniref:Uncharacterized protein n=1 Tax=marine sediment metagenome TaxID=412755 RepID=A0A0F9RB70_9ZZZZ
MTTEAETPESKKARSRQILDEWVRSHDLLDSYVSRGDGVRTVYTLDQRIRAVIDSLDKVNEYFTLIPKLDPYVPPQS